MKIFLQTCFYFIIIFFIKINILQATNFTLPLDANWKLRNAKQTSWMEVNMPSCVQNELIKRKIIPNPFWENEEKKCEWIEKETWEYVCNFDLVPSMMSHKNIMLILEGIDTYGKIKLNGRDLGYANNMHRTWSYNIKNIVQQNGNVLSIELEGAQKIADEIASSTTIAMPADSRVYSRKAAYQWGWDFAPRILTMGIYKPVYLKSDDEPIQVYPRYQMITPIAELDTTKFQFSKNGKPFFAKGINLVPPSSILLTPNSYYDSLIAKCIATNINLIRVWGGGVYPPDYFYELCDKNKIMVWQDFMFANSLLPIDLNTQSNILQEVEDAVRRLRNHTCIVVWCGNNEIYEGWNNWGWKDKYTATQQTLLHESYMQLFTIEIPKLIKIWDDARPYIHTSPKHGWGRAESMTNGDAHYWGVWWGKEPIENYYKKVPRFMSEFGMQAVPDYNSVLQFCEEKHISMEDSAFTNHQKNTQGFATISHYLKQYPSATSNMAYIYFSQLLQRDALQKAIMAQRSAYPYCNGSMPWQWNDVWPGISWSIIDYFNTPKAAYYEVQKLYAPHVLTLGKFIAKNDKNILDTNQFSYALSLCEPTCALQSLRTTCKVVDFYDQILYKTDKIEWQLGEGGNYYTTSFFDKANMESFNWKTCYLQVEINANGTKPIKEIFFFAPDRNLQLQPCQYLQKWVNANTLSITSTGFAKDVYLYCKNKNVHYSKNYFHLLPGETTNITVTGMGKQIEPIEIKSEVDFME